MAFAGILDQFMSFDFGIKTCKGYFASFDLQDEFWFFFGIIEGFNVIAKLYDFPEVIEGSRKSPANYIFWNVVSTSCNSVSNPLDVEFYVGEKSEHHLDLVTSRFGLRN